MLCAICCGRAELAKEMWKHCSSPIRAALVAKHFLQALETPSGNFPGQALAEFFQEHALRVLGEVTPEVRRKLVLHVPKRIGSRGMQWHGVECLGRPADKSAFNSAHQLGSLLCYGRKKKDKRTLSILDMAMRLGDTKFIGETDCKEAIEDLWKGKSVKCGRVRLHARPEYGVSLFLQGILLVIFLPLQLLLQVLTALFVRAPRAIKDAYKFGCSADCLDVFFQRYLFIVPKCLSTTYNERYDWSKRTSTGDVAEYHVSVVQEMLDLCRIPFVKRANYLLSSIIFAIFFVAVAFQPFCGPINESHLAFGSWLVTQCLYQLHHLFVRQRRRDWYHNRLLMTNVDILSTCVLIVAAGLRLSLRGEPFQSPLSVDDGRSGIELAHDPTDSGLIGGCAWSWNVEFLRILLGARAAPPAACARTAHLRCDCTASPRV